MKKPRKLPRYPTAQEYLTVALVMVAIVVLVFVINYFSG
jgi:hypothetical protein